MAYWEGMPFDPAEGTDSRSYTVRRLLKGFFESHTMITITLLFCALNLLMFASYAVYGPDATADMLLAFLQPQAGAASQAAPTLAPTPGSTSAREE